MLAFFLPARGTTPQGLVPPFLFYRLKMDIIDIFLIFTILCYVGVLFVREGAECAQRVWQRTVDQFDLVEDNTVPFTYASEAILITVAAALKTVAFWPYDFVKSLMKPVWQKTPGMRLSDRYQRLRHDMLLAVASMISGHPERATLVYYDHLVARLEASHEAQRSTSENDFSGCKESLPA